MSYFVKISTCLFQQISNIYSDNNNFNICTDINSFNVYKKTTTVWTSTPLTKVDVGTRIWDLKQTANWEWGTKSYTWSHPYASTQSWTHTHRHCEAWRSLSTIITRKKSNNLFEIRFISNLDSNSSEWSVLFMRSPLGRYTWGIKMKQIS